MAVYTEVSDDDLIAFIAGYYLGDVISCKGIAEGIENSNYLLRTEQGTFILTLYEKRVSPADLPFFIGLLEHLAARGVSCPTPVRDRQGRALRELCGRPAALVTFLDGMWPRRVTPEHCLELGRALARLHQAGADFPGRRRNALTVDAWRPLLQASRSRADEVRTGLVAELDADLDRIEKSWPDGLPAGVIHADLFPDNVFFMGGRLTGLIDFYFACNDFLAYDLAVCLNAWCFEKDGEFNATKARRLTAGYTSVRPLTDHELQQLPLLAQGAAIRFLLTRLYDWLYTPENALVTRKDPLEYLTKLRFHRGVRSPEAYGLG